MLGPPKSGAGRLANKTWRLPSRLALWTFEKTGSGAVPKLLETSRQTAPSGLSAAVIARKGHGSMPGDPSINRRTEKPSLEAVTPLHQPFRATQSFNLVKKLETLER